MTDYETRKRALDATVNEPWVEGRYTVTWISAHPPPVEQRPTCPQCGTKRRPNIRVETNVRLKTRTKEWRQSVPWEGYGHFCTLRCGTAFANEVVDRRLGLKLGATRQGVPA